MRLENRFFPHSKHQFMKRMETFLSEKVSQCRKTKKGGPSSSEHVSKSQEINLDQMNFFYSKALRGPLY